MPGFIASSAAVATGIAGIAIALRAYVLRTPGSLAPAMLFRPFTVSGKQLASSPSSLGPPVWRVTFDLHRPEAVLGVNLGLGEHVKIALPDGWLCPQSKKGTKPRSYSPTSDPLRPGSFDLTVKHYEEGCASAYIASLQPGDSVMMSRGWPLPADWIMKRRAGTHVGLVALGVGITEAVWVARAELQHGAEVKLLYANRRLSDRLMREELQQLRQEYPDRFELQDIVSREPEDRDVGEAWRGRPDMTILARFFPWAKVAGARFLVVGTKPMKKDLYAKINSLGFSDSRQLLKKQFLPRWDS
eukprot:CAMPEP_0194493520 /NCGR_PEP_ID=MMETSP0253-20130528/11708_1 /TAXON_ID=2966 /ORGANISM="Noctiluca scintillans" /LENGTH=300 /DNA_ID=CAMNT_0039334517 /DNA_START=39 /DNA_END=941 /DNA_ORIENTATION=-